jgi:hypothetical protein
VCCVKFGFYILLLLFFLLFLDNIFYSMCYNLIICKEKHKAIIYLSIGNSEILTALNKGSLEPITLFLSCPLLSQSQSILFIILVPTLMME